MTPLAMKAIRAAAAGDQSIYDPDGTLLRLREPHCFEMTAVSEITEIIWEKTPPEVLAGTLFPPARQTWLEMRMGQNRAAHFLDQDDDGTINVYQISNDSAFFVAAFPPQSYGVAVKVGTHARINEKTVGLTWGVVSTLLAIINTPKLVGRKSHDPHKGLCRDLRRAATVNIELRPWTEIKLDLSLDENAAGGSSRLSGRKCLHFCRSHIRIQNGKLVIVRPHWRGDAALGVAQSRYVVSA